MPLDLETLRMFVKVAELGSFTGAAKQLATTKSRVSLHVSGLEAELGTPLLTRTTRAVRLTADGEQFLRRARPLVGEADELEAMFQTKGSLRGRLRVDLPVIIAREVVIPRLPEFLAAHPQLEVRVSSTDRRVELVREGFDCVLRVGGSPASTLFVRRLGKLAMMNCASPSYLRKYGVPRTPLDLGEHRIVHYSQALDEGPPSFEYFDGQRYVQTPMQSLITVNNTDAYKAACLAGLGIIQAPRWGSLPHVERGELLEILPEYPSEPMPISIVHSHGKNVPKRVRAFMTWLASVLEPQLMYARA